MGRLRHPREDFVMLLVFTRGGGILT